MTGMSYGILAGYDGSPGSELAVSWAAREARSRGVVLTVCHACGPFFLPPADSGAFDLVRRGGEQFLAQGLRYACAGMAPGQVKPLLADGTAAAALCEHSASAEMVVVGSRGHGRLPGLLLGSVSAQVAAHAHGRVVIVRSHWRPAAGYLPGPVAVGADGSAAADAAVEFAFEEAELHGGWLLAVCALADTPGSLGGARRMEEEFTKQINRAEKEHPGVPVQRQVVNGPPRAALLAAAAEAQMLVLGARGRGGLKGMMLGSVSQALLHHAPCPVGIARAPRAQPHGLGGARSK